MSDAMAFSRKQKRKRKPASTPKTQPRKRQKRLKQQKLKVRRPPVSKGAALFGKDSDFGFEALGELGTAFVEDTDDPLVIATFSADQRAQMVIQASTSYIHNWHTDRSSVCGSRKRSGRGGGVGNTSMKPIETVEQVLVLKEFLEEIIDKRGASYQTKQQRVASPRYFERWSLADGIKSGQLDVFPTIPNTDPSVFINEKTEAILRATDAFKRVEMMFAPLKRAPSKIPPFASEPVLFMDAKRRKKIETCGFIECEWPRQLAQPDKSCIAYFFIMCGQRTPFGLYVQCSVSDQEVRYYLYVEESARVF